MLDFRDPVAVVLLIFGVVVGAAIERFLTEPKILERRETPATTTERRALYYTSLVILISLVFRFFIGATTHLSDTYVIQFKTMDIYVMLRFFKDLLFLIVFGVLLVQLALSDSPIDFTRWLIRFFVLGLLWCVFEIWTCFGLHWLFINGASLVVTALCQLGLRKKPAWDAPIFVALAVAFVIIFGFDFAAIMNCRPAEDGAASLIYPASMRNVQSYEKRLITYPKPH